MAKDVVQDAAEKSKSNDWCPKWLTSGNCLADCKYHPNNKAQQTTYQAQEDAPEAFSFSQKKGVSIRRFPLLEMGIKQRT
jgi:hypothetical protein